MNHNLKNWIRFLLLHLVDLDENIKYDEKDGYYFTEGPQTICVARVLVGIFACRSLDESVREHDQEQQVAQRL